MNVKLSVVMIVKNEADKLDKCLQSVDNLCDEIIILDSGSTDDTIKIAKQFKAKIFVNTDWQGFGKQRQIAQNYATGDWILALDADEQLTEKLANEIKKMVAKNNQNKIYNLSRLPWAFGSFIRHGELYPDTVDRLYPRLKTTYNDNLVHEKVIVPKKMHSVPLKGDLLHYTYDNLEHFLTKSTKYAMAWAKQRHIKGKKSSVFKGISHGLFHFIKSYIVRLGFLDGKQGILLVILSTHYVFTKYAALWLMNQNNKDIK